MEDPISVESNRKRDCHGSSPEPDVFGLFAKQATVHSHPTDNPQPEIEHLGAGVAHSLGSLQHGGRLSEAAVLEHADGRGAAEGVELAAHARVVGLAAAQLGRRGLDAGVLLFPEGIDPSAISFSFLNRGCYRSGW